MTMWGSTDTADIEWDRKCEEEERIENDIWWEIRQAKRGIARALRKAGAPAMAEDAETMTCEEDARRILSQMEEEEIDCPEAEEATTALLREIERITGQ